MYARLLMVNSYLKRLKRGWENNIKVDLRNIVLWGWDIDKTGSGMCQIMNKFCIISIKPLGYSFSTAGLCTSLHMDKICLCSLSHLQIHEFG